MSESIFQIEDEFHAEVLGRYASFEEALKLLRGYSEIEFGSYPNTPPCTNWRNCKREYVIREFNSSTKNWKLVRETLIFTISTNGMVWWYKE